MACFCCCYCRAYSICIAHFTKKNYVRRLTQARTESGKVIGRIYCDLTLTHDAALIAVKIFYRILKSNYMALALFVYPVNNAGLSRRLSASRGSRKEHHTVCNVCNVHDRFGNMDLIPIWDIKRNDSYNSRKRISLTVCVYTETGKAGNCKGKIVITCCNIFFH